MKKIFCSILFLALLSCEGDDTVSREQLVGTWKLDDKILTFVNTNFQYDYNEIQISGYFSLSENIFEGTAIIKRGEGSSEISPLNFSGTINISGDKLIFSNFSGTWNTVFYSSYEKK